MDFIFYVNRYGFSNLRKDAYLAAEQLGINRLILEFDKPGPSIKSLLEKGEKAPLLEKVPDDLGCHEMDRWNGLRVASLSDPGWSFVVTKWQVNGVEYWSIKCGFSLSNKDLGRLKSLFIRLVESISPDLAFAYDEVAAPYNVRYFAHDLGPWAGLRDVYWFNFYGKKYARLIGRERVKKIPEVLTLDDIDDGFLFVLDKESLTNRRNIIKQIGDEYFAETSPKVGGAEEKVGLVQLFKTIYHLSRDKDDAKVIAAKRPHLD